MTDIKIPSGPLNPTAVDAAKEVSGAASEVQETSVSSPVEAVTTDPLDRIAEAVAKGEIGQQEAVNQILKEVMGTSAVANAPPALRAEFEEILKHLLEEDPYLRSLRTAIAPNELE